MTIRIIPRLDIKGPNLVKGIHLEGLRILGKPELFARYYYEQGADELLYMDVVASLYGRTSLLPIIERTAREIFVPLTVGGGLRSIDDIRSALAAGADKVALNTAALANPDLIRQASRRFGSSTIVISIEAKQQANGSYEAYTDNGRERSGVDAYQWALRATELGAGEILLTSVDCEGTGKGFELSLLERIATAVPIPVIAAGGAGSHAHIQAAVLQGKADALAIASMLHYRCLREESHLGSHRDQDYSAEGNTDFLRSESKFSKVEDATIPEIKQQLAQAGVCCRPVLSGQPLGAAL